MAKKSKKEKKEKEEVVEEIHIEEEEMADSNGSQDWTEEFTVAANEMVDFVKNMVHEAGVRRIVVKNEARNVHFEIPLVLGVAGALVLPAAITMISVVAALVTECSILVERAEPVEKADPEAATA
ncbi:MAG: DUF4342 domain-containing protein [Chloroflexota bacterium]